MLLKMLSWFQKKLLVNDFHYFCASSSLSLGLSELGQIEGHVASQQFSVMLVCAFFIFD